MAHIDKFLNSENEWENVKSYKTNGYLVGFILILFVWNEFIIESAISNAFLNLLKVKIYW